MATKALLGRVVLWLCDCFAFLINLDLEKTNAERERERESERRKAVVQNPCDGLY